MRVAIASVDEFFERVRPAYLAQLQAPPGEPAALEIVLAPGEYRGTAFTVGDRLDAPALDITLCGAEPDRPPLLEALSLNLSGARVHLENLIVRGHVHHLPVLSVAVRQSLMIERCAFVGNQVRMAPEGRLVELIAHNPHGATDVTIRETWFVQNWATDGQALLACDTFPPHYFGQIRFDRVAFLDNHVTVAIVPHATEAVRFSECIVLQSEPDSALAGVTSPGTQVAIDDSLFMGTADLKDLVQRWSSGELSLGEFQPVSVKGSTDIATATSIDLTHIVEQCASDAERGIPPRLAELRAMLSHAEPIDRAQSGEAHSRGGP